MAGWLFMGLSSWDANSATHSLHEKRMTDRASGWPKSRISCPDACVLIPRKRCGRLPGPEKPAELSCMRPPARVQTRTDATSPSLEPSHDSHPIHGDLP